MYLWLIQIFHEFMNTMICRSRSGWKVTVLRAERIVTPWNRALKTLDSASYFKSDLNFTFFRAVSDRILTKIPKEKHAPCVSGFHPRLPRFNKLFLVSQQLSYPWLADASFHPSAWELLLLFSRRLRSTCKIEKLTWKSGVHGRRMLNFEFCVWPVFIFLGPTFRKLPYGTSISGRRILPLIYENTL